MAAVALFLRRSLRFLGLILIGLARGVAGAFVRVTHFCEDWLISRKHAQYGTAVMRIVLGLVGLGVLASNFAARSYLYGPAAFWNGEHESPQSALPRLWIFSLGRFVSQSLPLVTLLFFVLAVLAVLIIVGWRFRIVLPIYFVLWVSLIETNDAVSDQSDNVYRICLFFLFFADSTRRLSLDGRRRERATAIARENIFARAWRGVPVLPEWFTNAAHNFVLVILTVQVSFIYASGALYKASGGSWEDGIAVYAPLHTQLYGTWPALSDLVTAWGPAVVIASWGSIILQLSFPFMLMNRFTRVIALLGILAFHASIGLLMGLPWFSLAMIAIDAIFVRDVTWLAIGRGARQAWGRTGPPASNGAKVANKTEQSSEAVVP